jgi:hypothetical protein
MELFLVLDHLDFHFLLKTIGNSFSRCARDSALPPMASAREPRVAGTAIGRHYTIAPFPKPIIHFAKYFVLII